VAYNPRAKAEFDRFRRRANTLSLGVCNGCQLLALLGWVGADEAAAGKKGTERSAPPAVDVKRWTKTLCFPFFPPPESEVVLTHNESGRFESRFVSVGIRESPSVWLRGMQGSALGVWVAHGEGTRP